MVRWGVVSLFVWVGWCFWQRRQGGPRPGVAWGGNVVATLLCGLGHLPAASLIGLTDPPWIGLVVGTNALLGLLFGWLYWRKGLEAAMIAHASTGLITVLILLPLLPVVQ